MRPVAVVVDFPLAQFCADIDIIDVVHELPKFFCIGFVAALDFAVEMWRTGFDIDVAHA